VPASVTAATELALWELAGRWHGLDGEIARLDELLDPLVRKVALELEAAGDNPERLSSEAAFAHLCGAAPLPASSGRTTRHRFNPGGHREANEALWRIVMVRMKSHAPTRAYVVRRTAEGCPSARSTATSSPPTRLASRPHHAESRGQSASWAGGERQLLSGRRAGRSPCRSQVAPSSTHGLRQSGAGNGSAK
jgi:hypothetical protein